MGDAPVRVDRQRAGLVLLGVLIAGVFAVLVIVNRGDGGVAEEAAEPTPTPTPTTTPVPTVTATPTPRPTATPTAATTTLPRLLPEAAGTSLAIVDSDGLRVVDLDGGTITRLAERRTSEGRIVGLTSGVVAIADQRALLYPFESAAEPVDLGPAWDVYRAGPDSVWLVYATGPAPPDLTQVDASGRELGVLPDSGAGLFPGAGGGTPIVAHGGSIYAADVDGATRWLAHGEVTGGGHNHVLVRRCDEQFECSYETVDVETGEAAPAGVGDARFDRGFGLLSPDGTAAVGVTGQGGDGELGIVDLGTGEGIVLDTDVTWLDPTRVSWGPNGAWLYVVVRRAIWAVDMSTRTVNELPLEVDFAASIVAFER